MNFVTNVSDSQWFASQDLTDVFLHITDCVTKEQMDRMIRHQGKPAVVMSDHMSLDHTLPQDVFGMFLPIFAVREARKWNLDDKFDTLPQTDATFCFIANKKSLTRSLCIRMIEIFGFRDYLYTWSGLGRTTDMSVILQELVDLGSRAPITPQQRDMLLAPITINPNILGNVTHRQHCTNSAVCFEYDGNRPAWDQGLNHLFQKSAVALITESYVPQPAAVFTEKTVYAMLGCNFPIWVGGYQQAHYWQQFGFDVFDDVIDHGYQDQTSLIERCWNAVSRNQDLLSDLDGARTLRKTLWSRLCANRHKLLSGELDRYLEQQLAQVPAHLTQHVVAAAQFLL